MNDMGKHDGDKVIKEIGKKIKLVEMLREMLKEDRLHLFTRQEVNYVQESIEAATVDIRITY
jgi:hypothetical protein